MLQNNLIDQKFDRLTPQSRGPNSNTGQVQYWCLCDCGGCVLVRAAEMKRGHTRSCGCIQREFAVGHMQEITEVQRKETHPRWKGGVTSENESIRKSADYIDWRTQVFERDDYTCQKCGVRGGILNAHHIESFNNHSELRIEIANGITFCEECHKDFHHQHGNNCSIEQLQIFSRE